MNAVNAIILAGGKNSRMGGENKAFLEIEGKPIIRRLIDTLRPLVNEIIIVTNDPEKYLYTPRPQNRTLKGADKDWPLGQPAQSLPCRLASRRSRGQVGRGTPGFSPGGLHLINIFSAKIRLVKDEGPDKGPLMGLYSGLKASSSQYNFVAACDMPFLKISLIKFMLDTKDDYDILIPRVSEKFHTLLGIYSKSCIPVMEEMLRQNELRVSSIFPRLNTHFFTQREMERFDPHLLSFVNINTPEELDAIRQKGVCD